MAFKEATGVEVPQVGLRMDDDEWQRKRIDQGSQTGCSKFHEQQSPNRTTFSTTLSEAE